MSAGRLAACAAELLGAVGGPVAVACPAAPRLHAALAARVVVAADGVPATGAIASLVGARPDPAARQALLRALAERLVPGAPLVLVDHSQPRRWPARLLGALVLTARGLGPARARYPAARELQALGLPVEGLRLACGERIQLVLARRP